LRKSLQNVKKLTGLHGRWQIIHHNPTIVLDVAHNEDGIRQLNQQIEITDYHHLRIVIGLVKDKEIQNILALLPDNAIYYFTKAAIERALPESVLAEEAVKQNLTGQAFDNVNTALQAAIDAAGPGDLLLVCGSVFVVGEVEKELLHFKKQRS
jgi:dihydrofolate synthase/folylpolyglutamate synthase